MSTSPNPDDDNHTVADDNGNDQFSNTQNQVDQLVKILVPKIMEGVNTELPKIVDNILDGRGIVATQGYDNGESSGGDQNSRDIGDQTERNRVLDTEKQQG